MAGAEDFKLTTGTWVSVGLLRMRAIAAMAPIAQDIVVAGHDRADVRLLVFTTYLPVRELIRTSPGCASKSGAGACADSEVVSAGLEALQQEFPASSAHAAGALLMLEVPSIDAGEITDKGYNQSASRIESSWESR